MHDVEQKNALCCVYVHRESSSILNIYSILDKNFSEISPFSTLWCSNPVMLETSINESQSRDESHTK